MLDPYVAKDPDSSDLMTASSRLARDSGIRCEGWCCGREKLGDLPGASAVFITARRLLDGQILKTARAYFNGILDR